MKTNRSTTESTAGAVPSIVRLARHIDSTESAIQSECANNAKVQMRLKESTDKIDALRMVLAGLHREMDKHTAATRLRE